jgi:rRNA maturation protein Nop10
MPMVIRTCPNCRTVLEATNYVIRPGVKTETTCPKCGSRIVLSNDPSFKDASPARKAFYGLALIKTLLFIGLPAVLCVAALNNGQTTTALVFGGLTVAMLFIFRK